MWAAKAPQIKLLFTALTELKQDMYARVLSNAPREKIMYF